MPTLNMLCGLCKEKVSPLDAHMGRINGELDAFHIDCWNEHYKEEIEKEKEIKRKGGVMG